MCLLFLLLLAVDNNEKSIEVRYTETAPHIDGFIEEVWLQADSAYDFVQHWPYEKRPPMEKTTVYVLQDAGNLYFAFRCYADSIKPIACLTKEEDFVAVGIDPFGSKTTAYYFLVNASEILDDGWILDDGRSYDNSWDGVWYRAVKLYDDRLEVEIKIPFKSIRYKKGLDEWGVQFRRYIAGNREEGYWTLVSQIEGDLVSKWGTLKCVYPQASGYYFEFYPEGYLRYDRYWVEDEDTTEFRPSLSLNAKWDITSQTTLNATAYPDFAQIESDPFSLNLDRYPTYLDERRPFFLEGKDIFRMSDFGQGKGFFSPLEIFYSRRTGKSVNGEAVPIIGGLKLTNKSEKWNFGLLGAYTDEYEKISETDTIREADRGFCAIRLKRRMLEASDIGVLISGTMTDKDNYNYAFGLDGVYRKGVNQFVIQGTMSDRNEKRGWAIESGYFGLIGPFLTLGSTEIVHDSFDVSDIGFVPWAGRKQLILISGPFKQFPKGFWSNIFIAPGIIAVQEPGDTNWSKVGILEINPNTRHGWGCDLSFYLGPYYEVDTNYLYRGMNLSTWGNLFSQQLNFGCEYTYAYNYWRGFLAYRGVNWFTYNYSLFENMSIGLNSNLWIEWDTLNTIITMTPRIKPNINFRFNADINLKIFNEFVMVTPGTDLGDTDLMSMRSGLLFSWNFLPKSWLYIALNDHQVDDQGGLEPQYQIGAIKVKYLLYF